MICAYCGIETGTVVSHDIAPQCIVHLRAALAAAERERDELRKQVRLCPTCDGDGIMDAVVGFDSARESEITQPETCAECHGTGVSSWGQAIDDAKTAEAALAAAERERDEAEVRAERCRRERAEALTVTTREGWSASEWVMRTGRAEAELAALRARVKAGEQAERAAVVAWLRAGADWLDGMEHGAEAQRYAASTLRAKADRIEAGEHRKGRSHESNL